MRRGLLITAAVVAVLVAALAAVVLLIDVDRFRPQVEEQLESRLARPVEMGRIGLRLFPPAFRVEQLVVREAEGFPSSRPFVSAENVSVRIGLLPLLRGQAHIHSLILDRPAVELVKNAQGVWNYSTIGRRAGDPGAAREASGIALDRLAIAGGRIAVTDLAKKTPRAVYDGIDLDLANFAPGREYQIGATIHLPGDGRQRVALQGRGGPLAPGGIAASNFRGKLTLDGASLDGLLKFARTDSSSGWNGSATGEADLEIEDRKLKGKGDFRLDGVGIGGVWLAYPISVALGVSGDLERETFEISPLTVQGGGGEVTGAISAADAGFTASGSIRNITVPLAAFTEPLKIQTANFRTDRQSAKIDGMQASLGPSNFRGGIGIRDFAAPSVTFSVAIDQIDVERMQKIAAPPRAGGESPGAFRKVRGGGDLQIREVRYENLTLSQVKAACALEDGVARLSPVQAAVAGGSLSGAVAIDTRPANAVYAVKARLERVEANQLLSATTALKNVVSGSLTLDADTRFVQAPGQEIARTLGGKARVRMENGKIESFNLLKEMAILGKFLGAVSAKDPFTSVLALTGTVDIENGVGRTSDLRMEFDGGAMDAEGIVNLADQSMNFRLTTALSADLSRQAGVNQITNLAAAVLANDKGELVIPSLATGSMANPRFAPDLERAAAMKLKRTLPGAIGGILGRKPDKAPAPREETPKQKSPLESILDVLKPKAEPAPKPKP
ncbi:MAG: AsmA family protein [Bryobacteraceae bacterium]|nr:AsmA family protein [Bryobacteraceae bacterium]